MTAPVTIIDEHERALDYLYGVLDGEEKTQFEAHLASCVRCQAELEANGRVRAVGKSVLPIVEPSERLTGALHAQLLHEAAQRGKVLPFVPRLVRRVVRHPAYAAAAGLLIVGGAIGLSWSRGQITMPPPPAQKESVAAAPSVAMPADAPVEKSAPAATVVSPAPSFGKALKTPVAHAAPRPMKDESKPDDGMFERARAVSKSAPVGGLATSDSKSQLRDDDVGVFGKVNELDAVDKRHAYKKEEPEALSQNDNTPKRPNSPPKSSASALAEPEGANANRMSPNQAPATISDERVENDRRQAATFAEEGRCDEAASLYGTLDRRAPQRLTSADRLAYAHCLRVLGRVEPAQNLLDQLANTGTPAVAAEQQALTAERRKLNTLRNANTKLKRASDPDNSLQAPAAAAKPAL